MKGTFRKLKKVIALLGVSEFRRGLRYGVAATIESRTILQGLTVSTVVDVGANRGQFTLLVSAIHPNARVHAFEPQEAPGSVFERLFVGNPRVSLHRFALGPREDEAMFYVSRRPDNSSLLPITERQVRFAPGTEVAHTATVAVRPLDEVLGCGDIVAPALLKLDVQGYELAVLHGCERLLERFEYIFAEVSFQALYEGQALANEVIRYLDERGFTLAGVSNTVFDGDGHCVQTDALFRRVRA